MLIECTECRHKVSDKAPSCPSCGAAPQPAETQDEVLAGARTGPLRSAITTQLLAQVVARAPSRLAKLAAASRNRMEPLGKLIGRVFYPSPLRPTRKLCNALRARIKIYRLGFLLLGGPLTTLAVASRLPFVSAQMLVPLRNWQAPFVAAAILMALLGILAAYGRVLLSRMLPKTEPFGQRRIVMSMSVCLLLGALLTIHHTTYEDMLLDRWRSEAVSTLASMRYRRASFWEFDYRRSGTLEIPERGNMRGGKYAISPFPDSPNPFLMGIDVNISILYGTLDEARQALNDQGTEWTEGSDYLGGRFVRYCIVYRPIDGHQGLQDVTIIYEINHRTLIAFQSPLATWMAKVVAARVMSSYRE